MPGTIGFCGVLSEGCANASVLRSSCILLSIDLVMSSFLIEYKLSNDVADSAGLALGSTLVVSIIVVVVFVVVVTTGLGFSSGLRISTFDVVSIGLTLSPDFVFELSKWPIRRFS